MRAIKRFTITVYHPPCVLTGIPEEINTLVMTADINTALQIWDPFHDTVNTRAKTVEMGR